MALLNIVKREENEAFLRKKSREVTEITPRILTLLDDMVQTMREANGVGLAGVQVGVLRRLVVIETEDGLFQMINPKIIATEGMQESVEGCLSLPREWGVTHRPETVTVEYTDREGNTVQVTGHGLLAKAFCHELDHLDGVLFTDCMIRKIKEEDIEQ